MTITWRGGLGAGAGAYEPGGGDDMVQGPDGVWRPRSTTATRIDPGALKGANASPLLGGLSIPGLAAGAAALGTWADPYWKGITGDNPSLDPSNAGGAVVFPQQQPQQPPQSPPQPQQPAFAPNFVRPDGQGNVGIAGPLAAPAAAPPANPPLPPVRPAAAAPNVPLPPVRPRAASPKAMPNLGYYLAQTGNARGTQTGSMAPDDPRRYRGPLSMGGI